MGMPQEMTLERRFQVLRDDYGYSVFCDGDRVFGPSGSLPVAEQKRDDLIRDARRQVRPCITCRAAFRSDGPHNRMCPRCRALSGTIHDFAV